MNAILLSLVLVGQLGAGERPSSEDLMMVGPVRSNPSDLMMVGKVAAPRVRGIMVTAAWCPPCRTFAANEVPRLRKGGWLVGEEETNHLQVVDVEKYQVTALPVFIRLVDGKETNRHVGAMDALQLAAFIYPKVEAAPTPGQEVERVIGLLPQPQIGFVDYGCGDARWCIAAVERWGCRATGVEIDPARAAMARERVQSLGLSHLITIIEGDATTTDVDADVGAVYLYAGVLEKLRPRLQKLRAFASYMHRPPGLSVTQNGKTWLYVRGEQQPQSAIWQGQHYSQPICADPGCSMCNSIRQQLNIRR